MVASDDVAPVKLEVVAPDSQPRPQQEAPGFGPRWLPGWVRRNLPALTLVGLAITYPEFLTGSTPVLNALVNPVALLFLLGLYGGGVLLIREAAVRWQKGWPTVLLLGGAYAVLEEGIGTKTFFDPSLVGATGAYGASLGVNWLWAAELTVFHAIFSIALPLLTVEILYPATRGRTFLTDRGVGAIVGAFALTVALMFALFDRGFEWTPVLIAASVGAVAAFVLAARWVGPSFPFLAPARPGAGSLDHPMVYGAAVVWAFFAVDWLGPAVHVPVVLLVLANVLIPLAIGYRVVPYLDGPARAGARLRFLIGCLTFLFVLAAILGLLGDYLVWPVIAGLMWLFYHEDRRFHPRALSVPPPPGVVPGL